MLISKFSTTWLFHEIQVHYFFFFSKLNLCDLFNFSRFVHNLDNMIEYFKKAEISQEIFEKF